MAMAAALLCVIYSDLILRVAASNPPLRNLSAETFEIGNKTIPEVTLYSNLGMSS